jgi:hypothetical protein
MPMQDTKNMQLETIIQMLGQLQRMIGPLAGDVQAIRKALEQGKPLSGQPTKL